MKKQPRLTLVGAGPGDPELMTIKAVRVLESADVVLCDALVSDAVVDLYVPKHVPVIPVGKRSGMHTHSQDEINELIVANAKKYGHAVRLKGGDPFIFGRGHEELEYAEQHGIVCDVIPGISSALAVPESLRIPLTRRNASESFWVITGTTKAGELSGDVAIASRSTATVVILMGMRKIREIMDLFAAQGKQDTPVAVIQNGTLPEEEWVVGTVSTIVDRVNAKGLSSPAIIVIGAVAGLASKPTVKDLDVDDVRRTA